MFTVGLFSTHIPYIAFVAFYAVFFLFGIEKASAGDFGEGDQLIPELMSVSVDNYPDAGDDNYLYNCNSFPGGIEFEQLLFYEDKIKLFYFSSAFIKTTEYCFSWFSRPPPVA